LIKDTGGPSEDAEIVLAVYNPNKDHLNTYRDYDIKQLGNYFRAVICLKSRYGEADAVDCCYFNGKINLWQELPKPNEILDYSQFTKQDVVKHADNTNNNTIMKFTL